MRAEVSLSDTAQSLEEELIADTADRTVLIESENSDLAVMVAGYKEEFILIIGGEVGASHAVDRSEAYLLKISALDDLICFNTEVCDRIQILPVVRNRHIG